MTNNKELMSLIAAAEAKGAIVAVTYDAAFIDTVQVRGLKGCGPFPMTAIGAAERLRELV